MWLLIDEWMKSQLIRVNQSQFADAVGVERQAVSQWKYGEARPAPASLRRISEVTRIPFTRLVMAMLVDMGYLESTELASQRDRDRALALSDALLEAEGEARRGRSSVIRLADLEEGVGDVEG